MTAEAPAASADARPPASAEAEPWWRRVRLHSSVESANAGTISVLALAETGCAVYVYWRIANAYGTLHLTAAACIAPLLLLRSKRSTDLALEYARPYLGEAAAKRSLIPFAFAGFLLAAASSGFILDLIFGKDVVPAWFTRRMYADQRVASDLQLADFHSLFFAPISLAWVSLSIVARPTWHRLRATLTCLVSDPIETVRQVPKNWVRYTACIDILHPPEILPGVIEREKALGLRPGYLSPWQFAGYRRAGLGDKARVEGFEETLGGFVFSALCIAFTMIPTVLYRYSLKGTAILLCPLAALAWEGPNPKTTPESIEQSIVARAAFAGAGVVLVNTLGGLLRNVTGFDFLLRKPYDLLLDGAAKYPVAALLFPKAHLLAWHWFVIAASAIAFAAFIYASRIKQRAPYTAGQRRVLEIAYHALGALAVCTIFSLIDAAARGVR